jgi:hypothetical protein
MRAWADDMFNQTRSRTTPAGQEVIIGTHTRWNKRCHFDRLPTMTVLDAPHDGTVETRTGVKIAKGSVGSVTCNGRTFPALLVLYKPRPGFHGRDTLRYSTDYGNSQVIATVTVFVE